MKKYFRLFAVVVTLSILVFAGTLWAGPAAPLCPEHGNKCFERAGAMYCSWTEEVRVNKLVPGRAGMWGWMLIPTSQVRTKSAGGCDHLK